MRRAIVLRAGEAGEVGALFGAAPEDCFAARTSSAVITPSGPLPRSPAMSIPCSLARRRALGEIRILAGAVATAAEGAAAAAFAGSCFVRPVGVAIAEDAGGC